MKNFIIGLTLFLLSLLTKAFAQDTFEKKAHEIAIRIEKITLEEKQALKKEVDAVNTELVEGNLTKEEAEKKKQELAEVRAENIQKRVAVEQESLQELIQLKVDGKITSDGSDLGRGGTVVIIGSSNDSIGKNQTEIIIPSMKVYKGNDGKKYRQPKRTTSQFVFAMGLNNVMEDGNYADDQYNFIGSHFYEWGVTLNSRLIENHNLLHAKYGLSLMYNNLRPRDNQFFVVNGNQTDLVTNPIHLKESRFRNVYLVVPLHLEFDFSKPKIHDGETYFRTHKSFRMGVGGYAGINVKSKQILKYEDNDLKSTEKTKGDYNVNNFIYGVSAYMGYRTTSLYVKYDLNELFENNSIAANTISFGVRFDFN
ncbi:hypothetical protein [Flavobacterium agrisoli]|uniref:Outer membrane protein with beta-barrel domain n=1 Tax=Flavobacterium agrisoli TaxID=2793066 RepID=A0A934UKB1_9FLAO|nr:hypothetical protein [Flavobacterium agrisoli]MBK0370364.1 hypothetical protein [Flavobacterium agrisoli]